MDDLREALKERGITDYILRCKRCGKEFTTTPILKFAEKLVLEEVKVDEDYLMLCPQCKTHVLLEKSAPWYGRGVI